MEKELPLLTDSMESIEVLAERFDELYSANYGLLYNYDDQPEVDTEAPWFDQGVFVDMDYLIALERGEVYSYDEWH